MADAEKKRGFFIALEGIDGSGKSTQAGKLARKLAELGHAVHKTFEPTEGLIGQVIHRILKEDLAISAEALSLLFVADRLEHAKEIKNALDAGKVVISDRYLLSTLAYQGAQGVDTGFLRKLHENLPRPDLTVLLDIEPGRSLGRTKADEKFEKLEMLAKVRQKYLELAREDKSILLLNAEKPPKEVHQAVLNEVLRKLEDKKSANGETA